MFPFNNKRLLLTPQQLQVARRVTDQYYEPSYKVDHLGIAKYAVTNISHVDGANDYGFYIDPLKRQKIKEDHDMSYYQISNILVNTTKHIRIGKMRDTLHEQKDSERVDCVDGTLRIEARWCKIYLNKANERIIRIVYNLRIHNITKEPIVGIITCFPIKKFTVMNHPTLAKKYSEAIESLRNPMLRLIREYIENSSYRGDNMLYKKVDGSNEMINLTEDEVFAMSESDLRSIEPYDETDDDSCNAYYDSIGRFTDSLRMRPYYARTDRVNDPDGWLHEDYCCIHSWEPLNELNLLKYSCRNVAVYNELLDQKYEEIGGVQNATDRYIDKYWPEIGPANFAVAYGYEQPIVYKNLCDAFGKGNTDRVWRKYYNFYKDDGLIKD